MVIRFLADENFRKAIVIGLSKRQPRVDIVSVQDLEIRGIADEDLLMRAAEEERVLLSHDVRTMPMFFSSAVASGGCAGVILIRQRAPIGAAVLELEKIWLEGSGEEWLDLLLRLRI